MLKLLLLSLVLLASSEAVRPVELTDVLEYDDFAEQPPFVQRVMLDQFRQQQRMAPKQIKQKRYLGMDIPDYISSVGKADALKHMSNKMRAMGRR